MLGAKDQGGHFVIVSFAFNIFSIEKRTWYSSFLDIIWCRDQDGRSSTSSALTKGTQIPSDEGFKQSYRDYGK